MDLTSIQGTGMSGQTTEGLLMDGSIHPAIARKETMTPRERVCNAILHRPTDRMPIDLGVHFSTGISAFAYRNLREQLGLSTDGIVLIDPVQCLARVDEDILERFHCDCMILRPGFSGRNHWSPRAPFNFSIPDDMKPKLDERGQWIVESEKGRMRMPKNGYFFDGDWLSFYDGSEGSPQFDATVREAERIYKDTPYFTMFMELSAYFDGSMDGLCDMLTDPEDILEKNEHALQANLKRAGAIIDRMGSWIGGIALNSDLGMQQGPLCNPAVYDALSAPFLKRFCDFIHRNSDLHIFLHSCGSILPLLPTLIDCGIDILNPVQISAANMDPQTLKARFGDKLTFWGGGCNTQAVLNTGTPEQVADNVRTLTRIFKPGGGFVFNQVHNVMGDIPPENIVAMLDTAYEEAWG